MDEATLIETRRSLHAVAEVLLAGPQYRLHGTIRLHATPGGFGQVAGQLRVEGVDLVGDGGMRVPLRGTASDVAAALGVEAGRPEGVYSDHADLGPADELVVDPAAAGLLADWFARGTEALRRFAPEAEPVLWPEHFDVGIQRDEVNYGVSPGDREYSRPYAYVGPWTPRPGEFWNVPFGALRYADGLPDVAAVAAFFTEGREVAAQA